MSDIQKSKWLAAPQTGDLVRFRNHSLSPVGIVVGTNMLREGPHPSQPERYVAYVRWACKYTTDGNYQLSLLEVASESR